MTPLREAMIDAMLVRGLAAQTRSAYLRAVSGLARYYARSPTTLDADEIQRYFVYLVKERKLAPSSCRQALNGLVFLYREVLRRPFTIEFHVPPVKQRLPAPCLGIVPPLAKPADPLQAARHLRSDELREALTAALEAK